MDAAEASPGHLPMIRNMVTWLEHIGMITADGQFIAVKDGTAAPAPDAGPAVTPDRTEKPAETGAEVPEAHRAGRGSLPGARDRAELRGEDHRG